jgi:hypothetical protein
MKKLDTPEIGDPSVSGSGGVSADGAGARCFPRVPPVGELSEPPVVSPCPAPLEPFDFACVPCVPGVAAGVLPCACWARTPGVVVSAGAPALGAAGAGAASVVGVGVGAGDSGAGAAGVVSAGGGVVVVSAEVLVPVEAGCEAGGSPALAAAGRSANAPKAASSGLSRRRVLSWAVIVSAQFPSR